MTNHILQFINDHLKNRKNSNKEIEQYSYQTKSKRLTASIQFLINERSCPDAAVINNRSTNVEL